MSTAVAGGGQCSYNVFLDYGGEGGRKPKCRGGL